MAFIKNTTVESVVSSVQSLKTVNRKSVLNFSIPLSISAKSPNGSQYIDSDTLWVNCAIWGKTAEVIAPHLQKGDVVRVTGSLRGNAYNSQDGEKVGINMTVDGFSFVDRTPSNNTAGQNSYNNTGGYNAVPAPESSYAAPTTGWGAETASNSTWNTESSNNEEWNPQDMPF